MYNAVGWPLRTEALPKSHFRADPSRIRVCISTVRLLPYSVSSGKLDTVEGFEDKNV